MWKLLVAFIVFAAVGLFVLKKAGGNVDMGGEKHSVETTHSEPAASAPAAASAAASGADMAASAAAPASAAASH
jgi:hypothetical protein